MLQYNKHVGTPEQTRPRSVADWEQSWKSSIDQSFDNKPSVVEWESSWWSFHDGSLLAVGESETSTEVKAKNEFHSDLHKLKSLIQPQRFMSQDWSKSWRTRRLDTKKQHSPTDDSWDDSWLFNTSQDFQNKDTQSSIMRVSLHYESEPEWGKSWKISNPQPPKRLWVEAKSAPLVAENMVLWSRNQNKQTMSIYKPCLGNWIKAWRFTQLENMVNMKSASNKSNKEDYTMVVKRKMLFCQIDQTSPAVKIWTDAFKVAKSQPNQRRASWEENSRPEKCQVKSAEWGKSWKFTSESMNLQPFQMKASFMEWKESWKFLLKHYPSQNSQKKSNINS